MDKAVIAQLVALNQTFYSQFGAAFAQTRQRIQDGVRRVLASLPDEGNWLDVGCGSGALAVEWLRKGRQSAYTGVDFSAELLKEAQAVVTRALHGEDLSSQITYLPANLYDPDWTAPLSGFAPFRGALSFAVLHHLPSADLRQRVVLQIRDLLQEGGSFIHSEWQFQHSEKLMARRVDWQAVGLTEAALEPGDTLLDWRFTLPGQAEQRGLRYVHLFSVDELNELARQTGFEVLETFESDGQGQRLGLYQVWKKV